MPSSLLLRLLGWTLSGEDNLKSRGKKNGHLLCWVLAGNRPRFRWFCRSKPGKWTPLCGGRWPHSCYRIIPSPLNGHQSFVHHLTKANTEASNPIPEYLKEFTSEFSKQLFDTLPEPKEWDHVVELIPGSKPTGCKIYPLLPMEQKELDIFLKENLETGRIRPSKCLISSLVFFIKKKDSSLRLVQDYWALNAITVKNFRTYQQIARG